MSIIDTLTDDQLDRLLTSRLMMDKLAAEILFPPSGTGAVDQEDRPHTILGRSYEPYEPFLTAKET